jgi:hypothetical protein
MPAMVDESSFFLFFLDFFFDKIPISSFALEAAALVDRPDEFDANEV